MQVGIRELRNRLRYYVETAQRGEDVTVTEYGRPVAQLVAVCEESPIDQLIKAGLAMPPTRPKEDIDWTLVKSRGSVSDLIER